jgi:hypothetical protein
MGKIMLLYILIVNVLLNNKLTADTFCLTFVYNELINKENADIEVDSSTTDDAGT